MPTAPIHMTKEARRIPRVWRNVFDVIRQRIPGASPGRATMGYARSLGIKPVLRHGNLAVPQKGIDKLVENLRRYGRADSIPHEPIGEAVSSYIPEFNSDVMREIHPDIYQGTLRRLKGYRNITKQKGLFTPSYALPDGRASDYRIYKAKSLYDAATFGEHTALPDRIWSRNILDTMAPENRLYLEGLPAYSIDRLPGRIMNWLSGWVPGHSRRVLRKAVLDYLAEETAKGRFGRYGDPESVRKILSYVKPVKSSLDGAHVQNEDIYRRVGISLKPTSRGPYVSFGKDYLAYGRAPFGRDTLFEMGISPLRDEHGRVFVSKSSINHEFGHALDASSYAGAGSPRYRDFKRRWTAIRDKPVAKVKNEYAANMYGGMDPVQPWTDTYLYDLGVAKDPTTLRWLWGRYRDPTPLPLPR